MTAEEEVLGETTPTTRRVFELYVEELAAEEAQLGEALLVRLRWFGEDIGTAIERLTAEPGSTLDVMKGLSSEMQALDARAGAADTCRHNVASVRRWALLLPETAVHE